MCRILPEQVQVSPMNPVESNTNPSSCFLEMFLLKPVQACMLQHKASFQDVCFGNDPAQISSGFCLNRSKRAQEILFQSKTNPSACFLDGIQVKLAPEHLLQCKDKTPGCVFSKRSCSNLFRILLKPFQACLLQHKGKTPGCVFCKGSCSDCFGILPEQVQVSPMNPVESNANPSSCFLERFLLKPVQACMLQHKASFQEVCFGKDPAQISPREPEKHCFSPLERIQFKLAPACLLQHKHKAPGCVFLRGSC